ncbi:MULTISPECIES: hypothetical protein [Acidiphilium]|jgi:hypothetical protein|uniref:Lipoprotein n=2 Tax=Acidiphilium TaxID=522 RepID=A5FZY1_ACICJ|nr:MULTISPECIES: hypothetical protein [Acidiphilium]MBU6355957.1 hypothetical protein [Rhodospirillales bacterium]ABQ31163.1 hypothetical protein Acry_1962 [Acidiphilium cryptum JF-5]EGO93985.1 hypothetical protein APM_3222 [Acidiphilium sp. PM]KDM68112.1 hypothetical protein ACIDI_15c00280 [Acidiphilium sp. JA12-A1]MBS3023115.1 hypothetical protein [Acidiphilium multivorum]
MRRSTLTLVLLPAILAGCAVPGRRTPGPYAGAPSLVDVAALTSFNGRLPLVTIPESTEIWSPSVKYAVDAALKINPKARFRVYVTGPTAGGPAAAEMAMARLAPRAAQVADAIVADGVAPDHVSLGASAPLHAVPPPATPEIVVFAK